LTSNSPTSPTGIAVLRVSGALSLPRSRVPWILDQTTPPRSITATRDATCLTMALDLAHALIEGSDIDVRERGSHALLGGSRKYRHDQAQEQKRRRMCASVSIAGGGCNEVCCGWRRTPESALPQSSALSRTQRR
jgi:hypothetical protein